ncbi:galactose oxidase [Euzebyella marina]|uniref:Galactose oxidase n=1 Tax=Euzebyella marina TaxID=1761453 RepID=A0A3G2L179_9FLAO|nr:kelch repeat-containing protein [Euzebyella marina]AYN66007.1 galactose oxidase [Euzebyella marina]MAU71202.1 galactose oxidase [Pseudozobellia sp.]MBG49273.1 galactose oxidase [Pseudozobellia sp.]|tara:strand:+ start:2451 stop:3476 length:1026 start_codon:yes stop_codon:yes gene_type:complete
MKNFLPIIALFFLLASCKDAPQKSKETDKVEAEKPQENKGWQSVTSEDGTEPIARHEAAFVQVGDKFYLLGGRDIRPVSIYHTQTKSWSQGLKPPIELHHFQPVVFEDKIYIISALTGKWPAETPTEHVYIYDPSKDEWTQGDEIPEDRRRGSTGNVLFEDQIYVTCGIKNGHIGDHKKWMDRYDPKTGKWETLSDAPRARDHFQAVVSDGKIYALAGRNTGIEPENPFGGTIGEVDVYDIETDSWETLPNPIPTERAGNAALLVENEIWVAGGESASQEKAHEHVEALNLVSNEWEALPSLLEGRHGTGLILNEGSVYVASGCGNRGGSPELATMEKYTP